MVKIVKTLSSTETEPHLNGSTTKVPTVKGSTKTKSTKSANFPIFQCGRCDKKFDTKFGLTMHKSKMHKRTSSRKTTKIINPSSMLIKNRTSSLLRYHRLSKLWLKKASNAKDSKVSQAIFECLLDLQAEFG